MSCAQPENTAILVDGAFYCRRAYKLLGEKSASERATELVSYCHRHLNYKDETPSRLYRIFYYDCPPLSGNLFHPLLNQSVNMAKSKTYKWNTEFLAELASKRKVAPSGAIADLAKSAWSVPFWSANPPPSRYRTPSAAGKGTQK